MRRFRLQRLEDESGVSGVGYVAEGCESTDGRVALRWKLHSSKLETKSKRSK
jgi:hypothetical protein